MTNLKPFDPNAFSSQEREEMRIKNWWICPYCKQFGHDHPTGPTWKKHFAICRIID